MAAAAGSSGPSAPDPGSTRRASAEVLAAGHGSPAAATADDDAGAVEAPDVLAMGTGLTNTAAARAFVDESAEEYRTRRLTDGVARGTLVGPRPLAGAVRHVFVTSVASRIRAYYEDLPEASLSTPVVPLYLADTPSRFRGSRMRSVLKFAHSAGGCGLSRDDQGKLASLLLQMDGDNDGAEEGGFTANFPTTGSFVTGVRAEQRRVLACLKWMQVPIEVGGQTYTFFYRDLLEVAIRAVLSATKLDLQGGALPPAEDGSPCRSSTLDSDLFVKEAAAIKGLHGRHARPLFASLHADAAVVSWSGSAYVYPIRARFPSVLDADNHWVTVGYIPHIPKAVQRNDKARLAVSDARNDLLQRCLAIVLRRFSRASETGYPLQVPNLGNPLLVARIGAVVVDFIEERSIYALMGTGCNLICTHCRVRSAVSCSVEAGYGHPRNVVETLEAQLGAAGRRLVDARVSLRTPLNKAHSALAFAPALGAMHGLSTGNMNYFNVLSFDLLHVWKIGVLRTVAQRIPGFLRAICTAEGGAVMGSVQQTLDVLNLRGFELGRRCRATPAAPGYVRPLLDVRRLRRVNCRVPVRVLYVSWAVH